jgi:hypothetical protein
MAVNGETGTTLDGEFKRRYADKENLVPDQAILQQEGRIVFDTANKVGEDYQVTVRVRRSQGDTWAGGSTGGTAYALNPARPGQLKPARVSPANFTKREQLPYSLVSRSQDGGQAFEPVVDDVVEDMMTGARFAEEMALLYGGGNIGVVESSTSSTATVYSIVITKASWAIGLWCQMEGAGVDFYTSGGSKVNTNAEVTVTSVSAATRTVVFTGNATDMAAIAATNTIRPLLASGNWFSGIDTIVTNTGSLFGIDAATYGLWQANTQSAGSAPLSLLTVNALDAQCASRGGMGKSTLLVSPWTWADFNNDLSALRRYADSTRKEMDIGTTSLKFYSQTGELEVLCHPMVKAGDAFLLQLPSWKRIGSTDVTFRLPDAGQDRFLVQLSDNAGFEIRCNFDLGLICYTPARNGKITNIVPNGLA